MTMSLNRAWLFQIGDVMSNGIEVRPRDMLTKEIPQKTLIFNMNYPVLTIPERKLGYKFLAAEAWWLLSGHNDVASIAPYSKEISRFSDDGETFFGSYGPPFVEQLMYVVNKLLEDPDTRQATMTFWRPNPPKTKDVPCTIVIDFKLRHGRLNTHVFMRSSDNWLGIPYDSFNFTMMTCRVLELLNPQLDEDVLLGTMYLTAASSHLYERNFAQVNSLLRNDVTPVDPAKAVPRYLYGIYEPDMRCHGLIRHLELMKDDASYRWWE